MSDWIRWSFDGVGAALLVFILGLLVVKQHKSAQRQRSGHNSTNIQAGRDITFGDKE